MTMQSEQSSSILWHNDSRTVTLIDIPLSIKYAQGFDSTFQGELATSAPLDRPFPSNEPKTAKARARLETHSGYEDTHVRYVTVVQNALHELHSHHVGAWCRTRTNIIDIAGKTASGTKRKLDSTKIDDQSSCNDVLNKSLEAQPRKNISSSSIIETKDNHQEQPLCDECIATKIPFAGNCSSSTRSVGSAALMGTIAETPFVPIHVPPRCSFMLSDCSESREFHAAVRAQAQAHDTTRHFDFVLLDPPWPNRSVRRTHKTPGRSYAIMPSLRDIRRLILDMDLDMLMSENCLVGIWITNKPAVRDLVLGEHGVFAAWGVTLAEEWVWLKTTVDGEPVTPIDGIWRKPYEVLLLGRRRRQGQLPAETSQDGQVQTRVLVSVPDLHSRKPCLKELIGPLMPDSESYRALEVFARHLTSGWWSWGDECTKFNHEDCWSMAPSIEDADGRSSGIST